MERLLTAVSINWYLTKWDKYKMNKTVKTIQLNRIKNSLKEKSLMNQTNHHFNIQINLKLIILVKNLKFLMK